MLPVARITLWFFGSRLFLVAVAWLGICFFPPGPNGLPGGVLDWFNHWDAGWYLNIAQHGYAYDPNAQSPVGFFPLYPKLVHYLGLLVPDLRVAGYLLSNGLLLASCLLLWKLVVRDYGSREVADRSVLFLLFCPVTLFFSSIYTESLFLFLVLSVAWYAGARCWLMAGLAGFLAALTRSPGVLLSVLIAVEYGGRFFQGGRFRFKENFRWQEAARALVAMALPVMGIVAFMVYLQVRFGDYLAYIHAQAHWSRHLVGFWHVPWAAQMFAPFYRVWLHESVVIGLILTVLAFAFRLRPGHLALVAALMLLYCSTDRLASFPRYLSVVFPFYIVVAEACRRRPRLELVFLGISLTLAVISTVLFVTGYWFT